jgi:transcription-repair coupling factor (superfamily II helicase)
LHLINQLKQHNIATISLQAFGNVFNELVVSETELLNQFLKLYQSYILAPEIDDYCRIVHFKPNGQQNGQPSQTARGKRGNQRNNRIQRDPIDVQALQIGDYLVHDLHGIGKFVGKEMRQTIFDPATSETAAEHSQTAVEEYLIIEYASSSRAKNAQPDYLFVATTSPDNLSLYVGHDNPRLSRFGGVDFAKVKARTKKYAQDVAKRLVEIYAKRMLTPGISYLADDVQMRELEDSFEYELTPDQAVAIETVKDDMEMAHPMDRLICADVGFGKTEVALRAAFKAILSGKQVALLVPTTILSSQHFETFQNRYSKFPVRIELLNRFVPAKRRKEILTDVENGQVDLLIGTHMLLTPKVKFRNLGLLIIDEEQRFGTMHKELIKSLNPQTDILSMSATPIPRTLEMALTGIRDITTITTPPENRRSIITNVLPNSDKLVQDAIANEIRRGGQTFVIHNNVKTLQVRANKISELLPHARIGIAHGQMRENQIDHIIDQFWKRQIDVLVCTTIIETGIDIANANTLIVDNSDKFGLSQLHQLRGRIGRSNTQAYAYFLYSQHSALTERGYQRLETIQDLSELGSGTAIALKDLELRGAGNFLGAEQSGYIAGVGYEMYITIMGAAVEKVKQNSAYNA